MVFSYPQFLLSGISQISLSKAEFLPETFANLIVAIFFSLQMFLYLFLLLLLVVFSFFLISACVLTQSRTPSSRTQPSTHDSSVHSLATCEHAQPDSWPRPPGGEDCAPRGGASRWRRWTWLLSAESRHSYTMGPFTHMSDSVADWGRGTLRLAPSLVGGPQNCDGSLFISVHNHSYNHFCILLYCNISRSLDFLFFFLMSLVLPGQTWSFSYFRFSCHLK